MEKHKKRRSQRLSQFVGALIKKEKDGKPAGASGTEGSFQGFPPYIYILINHMKRFQDVLRKEGIFRLSARKSDMDELIVKLQNDEYDSLISQDPILLSSIMKNYLISMPAPLIPFDSYPLFIAIERLPEEDVKGRLRSLKKAISTIPPMAKMCLGDLLSLVHLVSLHSTENKMEMHNLAVVFGPTLLRPRGEDPASHPGGAAAYLLEMQREALAVSRLTELMIAHYEGLFKEDPMEAPLASLSPRNISSDEIQSSKQLPLELRRRSCTDSLHDRNMKTCRSVQDAVGPASKVHHAASRSDGVVGVVRPATTTLPAMDMRALEAPAHSAPQMLSPTSMVRFSPLVSRSDKDGSCAADTKRHVPNAKSVHPPVDRHSHHPCLDKHSTLGERPTAPAHGAPHHPPQDKHLGTQPLKRRSALTEGTVLPSTAAGAAGGMAAIPSSPPSPHPGSAAPLLHRRARSQISVGARPSPSCERRGDALPSGGAVKFRLPVFAPPPLPPRDRPSATPLSAEFGDVGEKGTLQKAHSCDGHTRVLLGGSRGQGKSYKE